jgi:hypothetical protein
MAGRQVNEGHCRAERRTHCRPKYWILRQLDPQPLILTVSRGCRPNMRNLVLERQIATGRANDQNEVVLARASGVQSLSDLTVLSQWRLIGALNTLLSYGVA